MRDQDDGQLAAAALDRLEHAALVFRVEAVGRLVENQQRGSAQECARECQALALALRLALARAFLRRPALLILDEATNSLDSENEGRVLEAIERRRGELTVVLIAHRLSTVRWADLIYVLERGTVVESGDWSSLSSRRDGRFRALWEAQSLNL